MAQAPTHSLLSLPDDEIIQKIREMSLEEVLILSFVSERCKNLVKSTKIKGTSFHVTIGSSISVHIERSPKRMELKFFTEPDIKWEWGDYGRKKIKLATPQSVMTGVFETTVSRKRKLRFIWKKNELTMEEWLKHLQDVFSYHKIDCIWFFNNSYRFYIDDIKKVFGNATQLKVQNTGCHCFNQMIIEQIFHIEKLQINTSNIQTSKIPKKVLMRNFVSLQIDNELPETNSMTLDELLLINSKEIYIEGRQVPANQLNRFIKLWQRGSNPRMEWFAISLKNAREGDNEVIMRGVEHCAMPTNTIRKFKVGGNKVPHMIGCGMDIYRNDGVKATIRFTKSHSFSFLDMYVWFDHCVVES
ncbi:unnamed protein product [Caenorhabditis brenneri]